MVYYNEYDTKAAAWLRQLITNGLIADGEVDERSIIEVESNDLKGFTQHHFFAGIGGWSYALRLAGWGDDRPVCTASLPCQPFSIAGSGKGKSDERHLLPHFIELVKQCNFGTIFGEQVPGAIKHGWLDDLCDEMDRENYAVGSIVLTAAGAGVPHIRQRLYWVANAIGTQEYQEQQRPENHERERGADGIGGRCLDSWMADSCNEGLQRHGRFKQEQVSKDRTGTQRYNGEGKCNDRMANTFDIINGRKVGRFNEEKNGAPAVNGKNINKSGKFVGTSTDDAWDNSEWLYCRDNKYRPIKPGIKPLAHGLPKGVGYSGYPVESADDTQEARVMRLKGYGNAIVPQLAANFIRAFMNVT